MSNDKNDASDLSGFLVRALRDFAQNADQADHLVATHLIKQLEEDPNTRLMIKWDRGNVRLKSALFSHTVRLRKRKNSPPRTIP